MNLPIAIEECGTPTAHNFASQLNYVTCSFKKLKIDLVDDANVKGLCLNDVSNSELPPVAFSSP